MDMGARRSCRITQWSDVNGMCMLLCMCMYAQLNDSTFENPGVFMYVRIYA
jgi:hypothetical protein